MKNPIKSLLFKIILPGALIIILNLLFLSQNVAEFFSVNISRYINIALGAVSSIFGTFSVAEWIFTGLVITIAAGFLITIFCLIFLRFKKAGKTFLRFISIALFLVLAINLTITSGYSRMPIDTPLNLSVERLNGEKTKTAAEYFSGELILANDNISRDENGNIEAIDFKNLNDILNAEFNKLDKNYFTNYNFKAKKVVMSPLLTYFSISGMYFPLTGEANVSTVCPNYQLPVIMAHELAHSRGVMREDEAEFLAYYVCINSDDPYLKYCGLMYASLNMICNVSKTDKDAAAKLREIFPEEIKIELKNASEYYEKYDNKFLTGVAEFFNNLWLKSNKVSEGTISYSKTTARLYALYKQIC